MKMIKHLALFTALVLTTVPLLACNPSATNDPDTSTTALTTEAEVTEEPTRALDETETSDATDTTDESEEATQESTEPALAERPVVISMHQNADEDDFNKQKQQRFMDMHPNIIIDKKVVIQSSGSDALVMFAAGTNPDIGVASMPQFQNYMYAGLPRSLDSYIAEWDDLDNFKMDVLENYTVNGQVYAVPSEAYAMVLVYNKTLFEDAGLEPPTTWDELYERAVELTDPAQGRWGFNLISVWTEWWFQYFVWGAGGDLTVQNDDGTVELSFTDPAIIPAIELYRKLIEAKAVQSDMTMDYGAMQDQFVNGNAAMTLYGSDGYRSFVNSGMNPEEIGYVPLPLGPSGEYVGQIGGSANFIYSNATDEKAEAVWTWMAFSNSKEETEAALIDGASRGGANPQVLFRDDVDVNLGDINPELQEVVDFVTPFSRLEFAGKAIIGGFVDAAVQRTMLDPSIDIMEEFTRQQELAQVEIDKYNQTVLEGDSGD